MNIRSAETRKSNREDHHVVNIFVDAEGYPVRFRIQPDLEASLRDRLEYGITLHGGIVISKIPIQGLVVVDPGSRIGKSLILDWLWTERQGRLFVSYSFILQCVNEKRLLPINEHALNPEPHILNSDIQYDLPRDVKDKLALFLATALPDSLGKRSSNRLYKKLVKNKARFTWVGEYGWRTLRNHYCRNKKYYDKLISVIVKKRDTGKAPDPASSPSKAPKQSLVVRKINSITKPSNVEAILSGRKKSPAKGAGTKKVQCDKPFLIERKRKFGNDITNGKVAKKMRTIDDMLKAPLPPIVTEKRGTGRPAKRAILSTPSAGDISEIEIGRPGSRDAHCDVWIDDDFKEDRRKKNAMASAGSCAQDRFSESLIFYDMDFDDLRLAASLDLMDNSSDEDVNDEASVLEILNSPTAADTARMSAPKLTEKTMIGPVLARLGNDKTSEPLAILELAERTRFTVEEIKQKLDGFSGNMNKTHNFFVRCRQLVDDLYISSSIAGRSQGDEEIRI